MIIVESVYYIDIFMALVEMGVNTTTIRKALNRYYEKPLTLAEINKLLKQSENLAMISFWFFRRFTLSALMGRGTL